MPLIDHTIPAAKPASGDIKPPQKAAVPAKPVEAAVPSVYLGHIGEDAVEGKDF